MTTYPQFSTDIQSARAVYQQDLRFIPAYEDLYLKNLAQALDELEAARLLSPPNRAALSGQTLNNYYFAEDFKKLNQAGILSQPILNVLLSKIEHSASLTEGFLTLHQDGSLMENLPFLARAPQLAPRLALGLAAFKQAKISNPARSTLLLEFPQLIPSILLLNKNKILDRTTLENLVSCLPFIESLTIVLTELDLAGFLNKDSFPAVIKTAAQAENLSIALRGLREAQRLKENFATLIQKIEHIGALASAIFNFNYGEVPLAQADLDLLFNCAAHAEPLSLVMINLSHQNLLEPYRATLAEHSHQAEPLLKLSYKLKQTQLFIPENLSSLFRNIQNADKILQACEAYNPLTQTQFSNLISKIQAERRISLLLGSSGLGRGNTSAQFFGTPSQTVSTERESGLDSQFKP